MKKALEWKGYSMKKRGADSGILTHQIKVRVSPEVFAALQDLSERRDIALAYVVREFIDRGFAALKP